MLLLEKAEVTDTLERRRLCAFWSRWCDCEDVLGAAVVMPASRVFEGSGCAIPFQSK